jgi:hypothetical protein
MTNKPSLWLLLTGPLMGFAFVVFLPAIGFYLVFKELGRLIYSLVSSGFLRLTRLLQTRRAR